MFNTISLVVVFLVGALAGCLGLHSYGCFTDFYDAKLIEILELIINSALALFVAIYVGKKLYKSQRRDDLYIELIVELREKLNEVYTLNTNYIKKPNKSLEHEINSFVKTISMKISLLGKYRSKLLSKKSDDLYLETKNSFLKFKRELTDVPFGTKKPVYNQTREQCIYSAYQAFLSNVYDLQIDILD